MGREKTTSDTNQTRERTDDQKRLDTLDLGLREAGQEGLLELQDLGQILSASILRGESGPGAFGDDLFGLSDEDITDMSRRAVEDIQPSFQKSGILDSGVAAEISGQVAGDTRMAASEFNVGAMQNLLNLAFGGQAQVQSPGLSRAASAGSRMAQFGTTTGSSTQTAMNPFLKSFQQSVGSIPGQFAKGFGQGVGAGL